MTMSKLKHLQKTKQSIIIILIFIDANHVLYVSALPARTDHRLALLGDRGDCFYRCEMQFFSRQFIMYHTQVYPVIVVQTNSNYNSQIICYDYL